MTFVDNRVVYRGVDVREEFLFTRTTRRSSKRKVGLYAVRRRSAGEGDSTQYDEDELADCLELEFDLDLKKRPNSIRK